MYAVRLHGRGGQGIVTTAELLAVAVFGEGGHAQAFPTFGSERTGAPVAAFCRIGSVPIRTHEPIARPDALIVADVALVIGANDVTNPAARRPGNAVSGMPILDVDRACSVVVIKRSLGHGYAGIDNELCADARTGMFFADAKRGVAEIRTSVKTLIG